MKHIIFCLFLLINTLQIKAQTIKDMYGPDRFDIINGAYYRDLTGFNNQYVGTWIYKNGNTILKFKFKTIPNLTMNNIGFYNCYSDIIVGGYQYIENGIEIINTLNTLDINFGNDYYVNRDSHFLSGAYKIKPIAKPKCLECPTDEMRLLIYYTEPDYLNQNYPNNLFAIRRFFEGGVEKLKVWFTPGGNEIITLDEYGISEPFVPFKIPFGEYILIKQ